MYFYILYSLISSVLMTSIFYIFFIADLWIYKGPSNNISASQQIVAPLQVLSTEIGHPFPRLTTSQQYVIPPSNPLFSGQAVLTTTQPERMTNPNLITTKTPGLKVLQTVLPTGKKVMSTNPIRISTSQPFSRFTTATGQPVQFVTSAAIRDRNPVVDIDQNFLDVDLDGDEFLKCFECNLQFATREELERHESNHLGEVNYICDKCGKEFSTKRSLEDHLQDHDSEKKFECDGCHKKFDYRDNLIFHMRIHGNLGSFKCPVCFKKFGNKSMRDNHVKKHTYQEMRNQNLAMSNNNTAKFRVVSANKEPAELVSDKNQQTSDVVSAKNQPTSDVVSAKNQQTSEVVSVKNNRSIFTCDVCQKCFPDKVSLETHKLTHIKFSRGPQLQVRKSHEANELKFRCRSCQKTFMSEHYLRVHETVCNTKSQSAVRVHETVCNAKSQSAVRCAFCRKDYSFVKEAKESAAQNAKFICEACCNFLAQKSQVSGFMPRLENRFICTRCDECFADEEQLRNHLPTHDSHRRYKCFKCNSYFASKKDFHDHKAICVPVVTKEMRKHSKTTTKSNASPREIRRTNRKSSKMEAGEIMDPFISSTEKSRGQKRSKQSVIWSRLPNKRQNTGKEDNVEDPEESDEDSNALTKEEGDEDSKDFTKEEEEDPFAEDEMDTQVFIKEEPRDFEGFEDNVPNNRTVFSAASSFFQIPDKVIKEEKEDFDMDNITVKEENFIDEMVIKEEECDFTFEGVTIKEEKEDESDELPDLLPDGFDLDNFDETANPEDDPLGD